ncbi:unnamed protein product [Ectocarpus sp. 12 AP-2014]
MLADDVKSRLGYVCGRIAHTAAFDMCALRLPSMPFCRVSTLLSCRLGPRICILNERKSSVTAHKRTNSCVFPPSPCCLLSLNSTRCRLMLDAVKFSRRVPHCMQ